MAKISEKMRWIYDLLLTAAILATATVLCTLLRRIDDGSGYVNLIFVLAVATISRWTEGYFWGIFSAVSGVLFVNYVFTYPYWEFNFTITGYPFTFLAMLTVSMMISAMNTQIKKQERLRIETEKEAEHILDLYEKMWLQGKKKEEVSYLLDYTNGHFKRGVE